MAQVSRKLVEYVAVEEGVVLNAYRCPAGVLTIGAGHTSAAGAPKVTAGMKITREEAMAILERDLQKFARRAELALPLRNDDEVAGGTSFDFNTGRIHDASWPRLLLTGKQAAAIESLLSWNKGGGRVLPGLVKRRMRERDIIFYGRWPAGPAEPDTSWAADLRKLGFPETEAGVKAFQAKMGLAVDGKVGPATRATIRRALEARGGSKAAAVGAAPGAGVGVAGDGSAEGLIVALILLIAIPAAIWGASWLWRNRGRITGRRVWA